MKVVRNIEKKPSVPKEISAVKSPAPGMGVQWRGDSGSSGEAGVRYLIRWETLGRNRDRPREGPPPEPSMLNLYKLRQ